MQLSVNRMTHSTTLNLIIKKKKKKKKKQSIAATESCSHLNGD